jgi:hypothetical protein
MPASGEVDHATVFRMYSGGLDEERRWIAPKPAARREILNESGDLSRPPHGTRSALSERRQVHRPSTFGAVHIGAATSSRHDLERFAALRSVAPQAGTPDQSLWSPNRVSAWRKALSDPAPVPQWSQMAGVEHVV